MYNLNFRHHAEIFPMLFYIRKFVICKNNINNFLRHEDVLRLILETNKTYAIQKTFNEIKK